MKPIRSRQDYFETLRRIESLLSSRPTVGSVEADELEVSVLIVEDYERKHFPLEHVDPISAIEYRMQEQGLKQKDLVPIIGSRSRVSEVMSGERSLTLPMIRALSQTLSIPAEVLIREPVRADLRQREVEVDVTKLPIDEMMRRGWLGNVSARPSRTEVEHAVELFLQRAAGDSHALAHFRSGLRTAGLNESSLHSGIAWLARVSMKARESIPSVPFAASTLSADYFRAIAQLSIRESGPIEALTELRNIGIVVAIEPALPKSNVDGAAFLLENRVPVIGLTLRFDRIDSFWFTLLHELAHVWLHLNENGAAFVDSISDDEHTERAEKEANRVARDAFIPFPVWKRSLASVNPTVDSLTTLAFKHKIHPAILAGRYQFESKSYQRFRNLLGQGEIRKLFPDVTF